MSKRSVGLLLALLFGNALASQEEAPDFQLVSDGTQRLSRVEATGSWTAKAALGWAGGWNHEGFFPSATYDDFSKGFVFSQVPDFSLGVKLLDRYFFRVVYTGSVEENSFELGYTGLDGEALRWVRAGNTPFEVPARAGTTVAPGRTGNPAFGLGWGSATLQGEVLVRYEDNSRETRDFRGFTPLSGPRVDLTDWIRGRFFQLPGTGPWSHLKVWWEDPRQSSGKVLAASADFRFNEVAGTLELTRSALLRVWVEWDGQSLFLIYDPGQMTGFELQDHFRVPEGVDSLSRAQIVDTTTGAEVPGYQVSSDPLRGWVVVQPASVPASAANARRELRFLSPTTGLTHWNLGTDVEGSSLVVTRNGYGTSEWDFQSTSGLLTPRFSVADTDEIHMVFQRRQKSGRTPDALGWTGAQWKILPHQILEANSWIRWNTVMDRYTTQESQAPGQVAGVLQWTGSEGPLSWSVRSQASARLADSTGTRHLLNWSTASASISLASEALRPAAAPRGTLSSLVATPSNRGTTYFRDFLTLDPLTGSWSLGAWQPGREASPTAEGGLTGPYLVRGDEFSGDRAVALDTQLSMGQWTGFQVFLDRGRPQDLSARSHVNLSLRFPQTLPTSVRVFFIAGALGENFDGSGQVKTVATGTPNTLPFVDLTRGVTVGFPVPEGTTWTNDGDADGVTTNGGVPLIVEVTNRLSLTDGGWQGLDLALDEAQRSLLTRTTAWGVVLTSEAASPITTTALVRSSSFSGTSWDVSSPLPVPAGSSVSARDISGTSGENLSSVVWDQRPDWSLQARFPIFHPSSYRALSWAYELSPAATSNRPSVVLQFLAGDTVGAEYRWIPEVGSSSIQMDLATGTMHNGTATIEPSVWNPSVSPWDRVIWTSSGSSSGELHFFPPKATDPLWDVGVGTDAQARLSLWGQDIQARVQSQVSPTSGISWSSLTDWTSRWGPLTATWNAEWASAGLIHSGYDAALALGLPDGTASLRIVDAFSDRLSRRIGADLNLPFVGTFAFSETSLWVGNRLEQNLSSTWSTPKPTPESPELKVNLAGRLASPGSPPTGTWDALWKESSLWLMPEDTIQESTWAKGQLQASWIPGDWGLAAEGEALVLQLLGTLSSLTSTGALSLAVPWMQSSNTPWFIKPRLAAHYTQTRTLGTGLKVSDVLSTAQQELLTPLGLVLPTNAPDYREDLEFKLELAHLPFQATGAITWSQGALAGTQYALASQAIQTQMRWDNLFGRSGVWPLFSWYRTDGLSMRWEASISEGTRVADNTSTISSVWEPEVVLSKVEKVALPLRGQWKSSNLAALALQGGPVWSWHGPAKLPFSIPDWISSPAFDRQLGLETKSDLGVLWDTSKGLSVSHWLIAEKIQLSLSERSEVHLSLRWGNAWQDGTSILALEAALEAVLSF